MCHQLAFTWDDVPTSPKLVEYDAPSIRNASSFEGRNQSPSPVLLTNALASEAAYPRVLFPATIRDVFLAPLPTAVDVPLTE